MPGQNQTGLLFKLKAVRFGYLPSFSGNFVESTSATRNSISNHVVLKAAVLEVLSQE